MALEDLIESESYKKWIEQIKEQIETYRDALEDPSQSIEDMRYTQGQIASLKWVLDLPEQMDALDELDKQELALRIPAYRSERPRGRISDKASGIPDNGPRIARRT